MKRTLSLIFVVLGLTIGAFGQSIAEKVANVNFDGTARFKVGEEYIYIWHNGEGQVGGATGMPHLNTLPDVPQTVQNFIAKDDKSRAFRLVSTIYQGRLKAYYIRWDWQGGRAPQPYNVWQPQGDGTIHLWNEHADADGPPEDKELFVFEPVDIAKNTFKIKTMSDGYLKYHDHALRSGAKVADADVFTLVFDK